MIKLQVKGVKETQKALDELSKDVKTTQEKALYKIAFSLISEIKRNILKGGVPLIPNTPSTIAQKGSSHPLIDTGAFLSSIQLALDTPNKKVVESTVPQAIWMEYGVPSQNIHARKTFRPAIEVVKGQLQSEGIDIKEGERI